MTKEIVVLLTQPIENNTSSMIRCKGIIDALAELGNKLTCICPDNRDTYFITDAYKVIRYGKAKKENVLKNGNASKGAKQKIVSFLYKAFKKMDVFGYSLVYLKYTKNIKKIVRELEADILITFSDPMTAHMIGKYCKKYVKEQYIQQWGDPLALDTIAKIAQPRWFRKIIEKNLIKKADRICYVSPFTLREQKSFYKRYADRMIFLPTPCVKYKNSVRNANSKIKLGYFGSYNLLARDLRNLYNAVKECDWCELYLVGDSDLELNPCTNIFLEKRVKQEQIEKYVDEVDILVCVMNSKGNQIPGKFYHYAGSYKEVLVIQDGEYGEEIREFFAQYNRYTFTVNSVEAIVETLVMYRNQGITERKPLADFDAKVIAQKLIDNGISKGM